jgi:hypothetical protein
VPRLGSLLPPWVSVTLKAVCFSFAFFYIGYAWRTN